MRFGSWSTTGWAPLRKHAKYPQFVAQQGESNLILNLDSSYQLLCCGAYPSLNRLPTNFTMAVARGTGVPLLATVIRDARAWPSHVSSHKHNRCSKNLLSQRGASPFSSHSALSTLRLQNITMNAPSLMELFDCFLGPSRVDSLLRTANRGRRTFSRLRLKPLRPKRRRQRSSFKE